jgi:hypothetical protein
MRDGVMRIRAELAPRLWRPETATMTVVLISSRHPCRMVAVLGPDALVPVIDDQLLADPGTADAASLQIADVIVRRVDREASPAGTPPARPAAWLASVFARYPGCAVAGILDIGCDQLVGLRDGTTFHFVRRPGLPANANRRTHRDAATACAALVHLWVTSGLRPAAQSSVIVIAAIGPRPEHHRFTCHRHPAG